MAGRWRALLGPGLYGHQHAHQSAKPVLMDTPALCEGERLMMPRLRPQKGAGFIEGAAKACGGVPVLEPTHGRAFDSGGSHLRS
jgi:hypothetical protein